MKLKAFLIMAGLSMALLGLTACGGVDRRTYQYIGYEWIQYIAQRDDNRALSIGLRNMDCVPGTMPDIILNNMTFQ